MVTAISSQTAAIFFVVKIQAGGHSIQQAIYLRNYLSSRSHSNTKLHYIDDDLSPGNTYFLVNCRHIVFFVKIQDGGHSILQAVYLRNYLCNRSHSYTKPHYIDDDLSAGNTDFLVNCRHLAFVIKIQDGRHLIL